MEFPVLGERDLLLQAGDAIFECLDGAGEAAVTNEAKWVTCATELLFQLCTQGAKDLGVSQVARLGIDDLLP